MFYIVTEHTVVWVYQILLVFLLSGECFIAFNVCCLLFAQFNHYDTICGSNYVH